MLSLYFHEHLHGCSSKQSNALTKCSLGRITVCSSITAGNKGSPFSDYADITWVLCWFFKTCLQISYRCHPLTSPPTRLGMRTDQEMQDMPMCPWTGDGVNTGALCHYPAAGRANCLSDPLKLFFSPPVSWVLAVSAEMPHVQLPEIKIQLVFFPFLNEMNECWSSSSTSTSHQDRAPDVCSVEHALNHAKTRL